MLKANSFLDHDRRTAAARPARGSFRRQHPATPEIAEVRPARKLPSIMVDHGTVGRDAPQRLPGETMQEWIDRMEAHYLTKDDKEDSGVDDAHSKLQSGDFLSVDRPNSVVMPMQGSRTPSERSTEEEDSSPEDLRKWGARKQPLPRDATSATKIQKQMSHSAKAATKNPTPPGLGSSGLKASAGARTGTKQPIPAGADRKGKRPAADDTQAHERRISLPKVPKISSLASPQSPDREDSPDDGIVAGMEERPPKWYKAEPMPNTRNRNDAGVSTLLQRLSDQIKKHSVENVREILHQLAFQKVNKSLLKGSRMLHNDHGLSQIFDAEALGVRPWPYDISADAKELYTRWCREIFDIDLLRGIQLRSKASRAEGDRNTDRIIPGYTGKVDFHTFGSNGLSNGQWFPTQLTTVRDGCHGKSQAGISGKVGEGAYSCIMTGQSGYPDEDRGDEVLYCGTDVPVSDSESPTVTKDTQLLLDSVAHGHPVRLIRKSTLKSPWAPQVGYRYDGLYDVKEFEKLKVPGNHNAARHRFRLVRCPGQDPIRGTGSESRPTAQEIERFKMDKRFR